MNSLISYITTNPFGVADTCSKITIDDTSMPFVLNGVTNANRLYTLGLYVKADAPGGMIVYNKTNSVTTDWTRHVYTFTATSSDVEIFFTTVGTYYIYHPKLEIGNKDTDWTAAPEDSIASVDVEYYLSTSVSSLKGGSWTTTAPPWTNGKYMWSRTVVTDGNGNKTYSPNQNGVCIAGATGKGVESIIEEYYQSTSPTTLSGGSWSQTYPGWESGKYMWTRSIITYSDNSSVESTPICVVGQKGDDGKGIKSTKITYQVSESGTTVPTGTWSESPPATTAKKPYFWSRTIITYTDNTTSTSYTVGSTPEGVVIGGRNLFRDTNTYEDNGNIILPSDVTISTDDSGYGVATIPADGSWNNLGFTLSGAIEDFEGEIVTISFDAKSDKLASIPSGYYISFDLFDESNARCIYLLKGTLALSNFNTGEYVDGKWVRVKGTFTLPTSEEMTGVTNSSLTPVKYGIQIWTSASNSSYPIQIKRAKCEIGNKATDWTAAPEDINSSIQNAQDAADEANKELINVKDAIANAVADIELLGDSIKMLVVDKNGSSMMTQTSNGWQFNMSSFQEQVDKTSEDLSDLNDALNSTDSTVDAIKSAVEGLENTLEYVNVGTYTYTNDSGSTVTEPCIELGESDSDFKLLITNTQILFKKGDNIPTRITTNGLVTENITINQTLKHGNFTWKQRSNGNYGLQYVP